MSRELRTGRRGLGTGRYALHTVDAAHIADVAPIFVLCVLALGLRLLVWRWHELYGLGGDEQEYLDQALTLLRERRYVELPLMRPPGYTAFLAVCIYLFDSLVQRLRLIQGIISALTIVPMYALAHELFGSRRVAWVAALLVAINYTLAAHATELLTETLFLFGLTVLFWVLLKGRGHAIRWSASAGLVLGALALVRSVALPLLPLGGMWLLVGRSVSDAPRPGRRASAGPVIGVSRQALLRVFAFVLGACLVILPWTARNYLVYGAPILIDTTGAENLWLDNEPAGREAAKQQLYALHDDRAGRQRLAIGRGVAAISGHPDRFFAKAWGEARKFFALEYFDDMRERRAIWVPPLEIWLRLLLGDGLWLGLLFGGIIGLWLAPGSRRQGAGSRTQGPCSLSPAPRSWRADPRWIVVPWALYVLLTGVLFHVELRYRLPLYPLLVPYAAWTVTQLAGRRSQRAGDRWPGIGWRYVGAACVCLLLIGVILLHRPYLREAPLLAWKHLQLWRAEQALASGNSERARQAAQDALRRDPESALARVLLARAALAQGDWQAASRALASAQAALDAHPYAHLLRGALLREQGQFDAARREFTRYERTSLEDLQTWAWHTFAPLAAPSPVLDIGDGLDLGYVRGFWPAEAGGFRWSTAAAQVMLSAPPNATRLDIRLASGRPAGAPQPVVVVLADDDEVGRIAPTSAWHTYSLSIAPAPGPVVITLRSNTFRPRAYDRSSPDGRALGVMVGRIGFAAP